MSCRTARTHRGLGGRRCRPRPRQPGRASARRAAVVWLRARPETLARRLPATPTGRCSARTPSRGRRRRRSHRRRAPGALRGGGHGADHRRRRSPARRGGGAWWCVAPSGSCRRGEEPMITVPVDLGARAYDIVVGPGARDLLRDVLPAGVRRVAIVTQSEVAVDVDPGVPGEVFTVPDGEEAKTLATVERLCRGFARNGLARTDAVIALGGGVRQPTWRGSRRRCSSHAACRTSTSPPPCSPRSTPPSAARRRSTCPRGRTWSARSGSPPRCCATSRP